MNEGFLNPQQILKNISLRDDMVACDFGCGSGGWAIPLARELKNGMVYAIDILPEAISALNGKISSMNLFNIKPLMENVENGVRMKDEYFDLVLITNLLFQIDNKEKILQESFRLLKNNGVVLVIDWKVDAPIGDKGGRISPQDLKIMAEKNGLKVEREINAGNFHWGIILRKI